MRSTKPDTTSLAQPAEGAHNVHPAQRGKPARGSAGAGR
jgi:hypothetical protein